MIRLKCLWKILSFNWKSKRIDVKHQFIKKVVQNEVIKIHHQKAETFADVLAEPNLGILETQYTIAEEKSWKSTSFVCQCVI